MHYSFQITLKRDRFNLFLNMKEGNWKAKDWTSIIDSKQNFEIRTGIKDIP